MAQDNGLVMVGTVVLDRDGGVYGFIKGEEGGVEPIQYPGLSVPCTTLRYINQRGEMVGVFGVFDVVEDCLGPGSYHGFLLRDGQFTQIDFPGALSTLSTGINDDGLIVGRYRTASGKLRGFRAEPIEASSQE